MLSAHDALERLREGNRRFASDSPASPALRLARRDELIGRQEPFAIVLGCSDSRVPAEIIFDQGLGDLFVIRVAGNIVAPSGVGSVEFAAARFGTRLVVVLGHSGCGAVAATIEELQGVPQLPSKNLRSIVDRVRPSVESLLEVSHAWTQEELLRQAVRANIRMSVNQLRHGSQLNNSPRRTASWSWAQNILSRADSSTFWTHPLRPSNLLFSRGRSSATALAGALLAAG
jgi:carbonic anhydrase